VKGRKPVGGGGVAEGVGLQTLNGTGRANSFCSGLPDRIPYPTQSNTKYTSRAAMRGVDARDHRAGG
jgi:hypothetical protein